MMAVNVSANPATKAEMAEVLEELMEVVKSLGAQGISVSLSINTYDYDEDEEGHPEEPKE